MENAPEAPAAAPAAESEATPNTNPTPAASAASAAPAAAPDMHGFTSEQLAEMRKFYDANGGFDKVKAKISNPTPAQPQQPNLDATYAMKKEEDMLKAPQTEQPKYQAPVGSITREEFLAQQYFGTLSREEKYANIAKDIENGAVLKEMATFNIRPINQDGSINDAMVRRYLDLKAQTVTAKQTSVTPEASAAPTVDYVPYDEKNMSMSQAVKILQQDSALKSRGQAGHPNMKEAEDFMRNLLNKSKK